ncbi:MAG: tetratricopeptide repeat protein [Promethearchaeota archaeon]
MKKANLKIEDLLGNDLNLTFLVGAGCSIDVPSSQPAGRSMMEAMIKFACAESEVENILKINELRFEGLVEIIRDNLDPNLKIIDYYGLCDKPNTQHFYLAEKISQGHFVMTTNFDFLIEHALLQLGIPKEQIKIIITEKDFENYPNPSEMYLNGIKTLYKVHGSTKNIISEEYTRDTLVATIQAFGSNKEGMSVFQVEPYKKPLFDNISNGRSLIVMGYSGSDDFDIVPTLKKLQNIDKIVWVNFVWDDKGKEAIYEIESTDISTSSNMEKVDQILSEIKQMNNAKNVYRLDVNTSRLVQKLLSVSPKLSEDNFSIPPLGWLKENITPPNELMRYFIPQTIYFDFNLMDDSLRCAQKLLQISEQIKDDIMIVKSLNLIGKIHYEKGSYPEALKLYNQALKSAEKIETPEWKAACYNNIANIYNAWGKYDDALKNFNEAIPLFEQIDDYFAKAITLRNISSIMKNMGNNVEALEKATEALQIFNQMGKLSDKADMLMIIGMIQLSLGNVDAAYKSYEESLRINDLLSDLDAKVACLNTIGELFRAIGRFYEALEYFKNALDISIKIGALSKRVSTLNNIGLIYTNLNNFTEALNYFDEALKLGDSLNDPILEGTNLSNIALVYFYQGNQPKAMKVWEKVLKIFQRVGYQLGVANTLINLGKIYREKEDLKKALEAFEEASELSAKMNQLNLQAKCLEDIGMILEDQKNLPEALTMYENALELYKQIGDPVGMAEVIHNIGTIDFYEKNYDSAIQKYQDALQILQQIGLSESPLAQTIMRNIEYAEEKKQE